MKNLDHFYVTPRDAVAALLNTYADECFNDGKEGRTAPSDRTLAAHSRLMDALLDRPAPVRGENSKEWRLLDRVEFALRDAGFDLDEAFAIAHHVANTYAVEVPVRGGEDAVRDFMEVIESQRRELAQKTELTSYQAARIRGLEARLAAPAGDGARLDWLLSRVIVDDRGVAIPGGRTRITDDDKARSLRFLDAARKEPAP